jgi:hypothetical protein
MAYPYLLTSFSRRPVSQPSELRLEPCETFSEGSGRGQCGVVVDTSAFPPYGSPAASATVRLEVAVDGVVAAVGESFPLELRAAPAYPALEEVQPSHPQYPLCHSVIETPHW